MNVMFHVYKKNPRASFGFIGANCENETQENTKRYRVYRKIVATQISENKFIHTKNQDKSACMLINRDELKEYPNLVEEIERTFQELWTGDFVCRHLPIQVYQIESCLSSTCRTI